MRQRFGVVVTPPGDVSLMLKGVQACFGYRGVSSIDPHITLVPPFNLDRIELPRVLSALGSVGCSLQPFEVELGSLRSFDSNGDVLFFEVSRGVRELEEVYLAVMETGVFREVERRFVPHLTVAIGVGSERTLQANRLLDPINLSFTVDALDTLTKVAGERWSRCGSSVLGLGSVRSISHLRVGFYLEVGVSQGVLDAFEVELEDDHIDRSVLEVLALRSRGGTYALVAYQDSRVLGTVIYTYVSAKLVVIDYVVVFNRENRGFGLGRSAVSFVLDVLRKDNVSYVIVRSNPSSRWLEQLGFVAWSDSSCMDLLAKLVTSERSAFLVRELC